MTPTIPFDNSFARLPARFFARQAPDAAPAPALVAYNAGLARKLGLGACTNTDADTNALAQAYCGNALLAGAEPLAQAYAGHQFGGFSPQLGDGRALLLGEVVGTDGRRYDIQLKGSGRTPFSRGGDGKAWLGPVLREYVVSEAMAALGVPTTRALAAVTTGASVMRHAMLPGAVLTRVAASHLRVGTFQYFAVRQDVDALRALLDFAIARHDPAADGPAAFLQGVINRQAELVAHWMSVGFIHGVMNTDNTSISGETIDYGPCAFLDRYHPDTVFSSIDHAGRYAYAHQADIIVWNLAQLASALVILNPDQDAAVDDYTQRIHAMPALVQAAWLRRFAAKIGIATPTGDDKALIDRLLALMAQDGADFTNTFRALTDGDAAHHFSDTARYGDWAADWRARIKDEDAPETVMQAANPVYIPRNHRVEQMINAAVEGDLAPFKRLMQVLSAPYRHQSGAEDLIDPPRPDETVAQTFCGT